MDNRQRIERFLRKNIWNESTNCSKIVIRHVSSGNKIGNEIAEFDVNNQMTATDIEALVNNIELATYDDAEGIGGTQKYVILPTRKNSEKSFGRLVFIVSSNDGDIDDTLDSEPPTNKGIVTQLMRHNEAIMRQHTMGVQAVMQAQQRTIARQSEQLEALTSKHFEAVSLIEELASEKHIRELEEKKVELKQKMQMEAFDNVKMLLPAVVNRISGKKIVPEKVTPQQMLLKKFADTLKPEQIERLSKELTREQQIAFFELYSSLHDVDDNGEQPNDKEKAS